MLRRGRWKFSTAKLPAAQFGPSGGGRLGRAETVAFHLSPPSLTK